MTLRENFELIQNETRNEENLFHVLELYEQVSKEDALLYFDISMYLVDYYLEQDDFSSAIKTCEDFLKEDLSLEYKKQLLIIDKFIAVLLKIEDFHKLEEVLHIRLRYSSEDKQANMMQYFYLAVCYEGLHRYHDAIQVLNTIPDTLSNNNLVSKYLKLAMLTLRVSQPNDALDFYNKAVLFDPKRKNTMFYLVDSDILYAQGEYKKSLDSFQDFFLKSKTNHRYLDRFIIISLALEHYQEAYHFYKEYEPRVRQSISKSYQLQFYEATLEMFKRMNMTNEFLEIQDRINYLNNHEQSIINQFGLVETFYTELSKIKDFEKTRDLYLHASRAFHQAYEPKSFHFFEISDESFLLYTFRKHLLIEKKIKKDTSNTFLEILRNQTTRIEIYHPSSFNLYEDLPDPIFMNAELVICIKLNMVFDYPSFCFITLDNPTEFDTSYRLMSILSTWINQQLLYLNIAKEQKDLHQLLLQIPLVFHQAIIRFDKGKILYFNDYAKSLLPMISRNDTFDKIQKHIVSPRIYFDDFLTQKDLRLTLQITEDKVLHLDVKSIATDTNLLLVFQESKEIKSEEKTESKKFLRSNILSFHHLEEKYLSYEAASTFIYFEIDHFEDTFKTVSYHSKSEVEHTLSSTYEEMVKDYNLGLFESIEGGWVLWLKTTDKRVLQRIFNDLKKQIHHLNNRYQLYAFALPIQKSIPFHETIQTLYTYYYKYRTIDEIVVYERKYYSEVNLRKTLLIHAEKLLGEDVIPLVAYPVRTVSSELDQGYFIGLDPSAIFGDEEKILQTLIEYGLTKKYDEKILKSILKQKSIFDRAENLGLFLLVHDSLSMDFALLTNLLKRISRRRDKDSKNVILYDISLGNEKLVLELIQITKKEGFEVAIGLDEDYLKETLRLHQFADYLFVKDQSLETLKLLQHSIEKDVIYHHQGRSLLKSEIQELRIAYLFGELYPYLNM